MSLVMSLVIEVVAMLVLSAGWTEMKMERLTRMYLVIEMMARSSEPMKVPMLLEMVETTALVY